MTAERLTVLQLGDVAGVAPALTAALRSHTDWSAVEQGLLNTGAGAVRPVRVALQPLRAAAAFLATQRAIARAHPDIVHLHWARLAPFIGPTRCPLVIHAHGSDVRGRAHTRSGRLVWRRLLDADLVLASTPDLLAELPPGSVHLPNPIDVDLFTPVDGGAEGDGILVFARLNDVKGAPTIIEAVRRLRVEHPDVGIRAFAGGSYDAEAGRAGVTLLQPGDRACVLRELRAASVVIGQQRLGQLGLSELEAMACARAVVVRLDVDATDDPPPVARVDGVDTIVDACATLLADPDGRRALGAAARRFVVERHGSETIAQRLDKLYRGVL